MLLILSLTNTQTLLLSSDLMKKLKDSLFSSSNRRKSGRTSQNSFKNYSFHLANNSFIDSALYTFENNYIELGTIDSDEETQSNNTERIVRSRHLRQNTTSDSHNDSSTTIVEKPILPNETLQAFAIRYRIPVSQLKRLNNLQNDQDFYALKTCRIPIDRSGFISEPLPSSSSTTIVDLNDSSTLSLPVTHLSQQNHQAFLDAMDQDLALMRTKVEQLIETPTPIENTDIVKPIIKPTTDLKCDGADWGCQLWHIVLIVILLLLIPFIFTYFYIKSHLRHKL